MFSIVFSLKTSFSALSHKAPAFIYIVFISFIATDLRPHVLSLSTIHIHLNQLVFHHLSTKRLQARFLSHSLLIYIQTPRNSQRATRSTAHLAGAPRILLRLIDPWCFVLFLCRALHSIATYELITGYMDMDIAGTDTDDLFGFRRSTHTPIHQTRTRHGGF